MHFNVRLLDDIEAVSIAQRREFRRVGIMGGSDRIDVSPLPLKQIRLHCLNRCVMSINRMGVMPVDSVQFYGDPLIRSAPFDDLYGRPEDLQDNQNI